MIQKTATKTVTKHSLASERVAPRDRASPVLIALGLFPKLLCFAAGGRDNPKGYLSGATLAAFRERKGSISEGQDLQRPKAKATHVERAAVGKISVNNLTYQFSDCIIR